ncbi:DNA-processing protein DprA [Massilia sp. Leaf139]|uniref:DNA-processing protein DprA n=1 Tax=Massilia sp. Leaf139 TaxID=1736272 RepID=UPI0006F79F1B|nr:DNA-processing protein DprA [Massilia sp. Leaf139]KQQ91983.1 DNA processing protein DprA [Massilia sp. Leaf139]
MQDTEPTPASRSAALIDDLSDDLTDWLRLDGARGVGPRTAHALLAAFGSPRAIFEAGHDALAFHVGPALARSLCAPPSRQTRELIDTTIDWLHTPSHHVLALGEANYPQALANIPDPPLLLYIKGRIDLLARPALAIVGSRNATAQGKANAGAFAAALSNAGVCVVSGLALGIDAAAHEGALRGAGSTIAVVGTGADLSYPPRNRSLAERIAHEGCIVSEFALGTPPTSGNFPRRNRIISGLSSGVLVVEAAAQSGSLITARVAAEQGREVFALPGSIHAPLAKGCHQLIRDGARLVETVHEVLEALQVSPLACAPVSNGAATQALPTETGCTELLDQLGHEALDVDDLLERTGSDIGQLSMGLLALEMAGMIERLPGGKVQRIHN